MNDGASSVPRRKLAQLLYGRDSVFARQPTPAQACYCPGPLPASSHSMQLISLQRQCQLPCVPCAPGGAAADRPGSVSAGLRSSSMEQHGHKPEANCCSNRVGRAATVTLSTCAGALAAVSPLRGGADNGLSLRAPGQRAAAAGPGGAPAALGATRRGHPRRGWCAAPVVLCACICIVRVCLHDMPGTAPRLAGGRAAFGCPEVGSGGSTAACERCRVIRGMGVAL